MRTGYLPYDWTTANIVPVFKKNDKPLPFNYRPISLTSIVVKVMEQIIHSRLIEALSNNNQFCDSQHSFRSNKSTVSLLLQAVDDWSLCLEHRGTMHCLFLDFAKAFDSVPHERLLLKLNALGVNGNLLNWIRSFFDKQTSACSY